MSPDDAEAWATANNQPSFESRPDVSGYDPMAAVKWTLPMVAAWFIWHDIEAVRDQWNRARTGWVKWLEEPPKLFPHAMRRTRWRLRELGAASLKDLFAQVRKGGFTVQTANPYVRLKHALQSGKLVGMQVWQSDQREEAEPIPRHEWYRRFHELTQSSGPQQRLAKASQMKLPKGWKSKPVTPVSLRSKSQAVILKTTQSSQKSLLAEGLSSKEEDDDLNLSLFDSDDDEIVWTSVKRYPADDNEIFFSANR